MKKLPFLPLIALFLVGCVSPPKGLEKDQFTIQSFDRIEADDYTCRCKKVRLGGKVVSAVALKDKTKVEVLSLPISSFSAKPVLSSVTDGRFIAYLQGFVDPTGLKDQYITVAGLLTGQETGKVDEADYRYPVIEATAVKQWRLVQEYYYEADDWDSPFYRPFGWGWRHRSFWHAEPRVRYNLY